MMAMDLDRKHKLELEIKDLESEKAKITVENIVEI